MQDVLDFPNEPFAPKQYAGFWIRFVAYVLDYILMSVASAVITNVAGIPITSVTMESGLSLLLFIFILQFSIYFGYHTLMVASKHQGTLGKMAVGIKIGDQNGAPLSFGVAALRFFASALSWITLCIGFIYAGFDARKQALHDKIAGTFVYYSR